MQDFRKLRVWQKTHGLTLEIYRTTMAFPASEHYGLTAQMRRSAASIGCNIAEGCGRDSGPDFARFLQLAMGSASELEYQILLATDLGFVRRESAARFQAEVMEVKRMLATLIPRVRHAASSATARSSRRNSSTQPASSGRTPQDDDGQCSTDN